jgi:hypothetical protein
MTIEIDDAPPVHQLIYISHAGPELVHLNDSARETALLDLVRGAAWKNQQCGVTGMLLARRDVFIQVLEGTEAALTRLIEVIKDDARHLDMHVIGRRQITHRTFSGWSMRLGQVTPEGAQSLKALDYDSLLIALKLINPSPVAEHPASLLSKRAA